MAPVHYFVTKIVHLYMYTIRIVHEPLYAYMYVIPRVAGKLFNPFPPEDYQRSTEAMYKCTMFTKNEKS